MGIEQAVSETLLTSTSTNESISIGNAQAPGCPLIYVNKGFERITGYLKDEIIGKNRRFL